MAFTPETMVRALRLAADDPMWAHHVEIPKSMLKIAADMIEAKTAPAKTDEGRNAVTDAMVESLARAICISEGVRPDADWRIRDDGTMLAVAVKHPEEWRRRTGKARAVLEAALTNTAKPDAGDIASNDVDRRYK